MIKSIKQQHSMAKFMMKTTANQNVMIFHQAKQQGFHQNVKLANNQNAQLSHLVIGGGSGFLGKQVLKQLLKSHKGAAGDGFTQFQDELSNLSQITIISRNPKETKLALEKELKNLNLEKNSLIQIGVKNWKDDDSVFLFNHQIFDEKETYGRDKKVAAINLSGVSIGKQSWTPKYRKEIFESRTKTTLDLIQYLDSFGESASTFIGTSAVGFYPCTTDGNQTNVYTEDLTTPANNQFGELTNAVEEAIKNTNSNNIKNKIIMRPGVLIGKGGGVLNDMMVPYIGLAIPIVFGNGNQPFSCIHLEDAANMYIHALYQNFNSQNKQVAIYNTVMPELVNFKQFVKCLNSKANPFSFPLIPFPYSIVKTIFGKERAQLLCEGQFVLPARAQQENFQFKYPTLDSMIEQVTSRK
ncbi:predicted protein [Naegleria gruberi]|uniref:Predicted protein n=1 Tax=Naegleria gruberi TaxID=5762 RepID=D2VGS2_NAEGR|nr:uncharacterized protein NAEGRDRAFT_49407 [Naegleria gruberi]EFC44017.1 predicted protein [Naegleria gruberi]|eukprot:XP_002676761.1 predicted protein [Naegleria gruberi strain NEG-M]